MSDDKVDFFVSYASEDESYAEWIDQVLRKANLSTITASYDFRSGANFVVEMSSALDRASQVLLVWSGNAAAKFMVQTEWTNALAAVPSRVVPVLLDLTPKPAILNATVHIDLSSVANTEEAQRLLEEGIHGKSRPVEGLRFPRDDNDESFPTTFVQEKPQSLSSYFRSRSKQEDFAESLAGCNELWMAAKGFEALLHQHESQIRKRIESGMSIRFLMNDPDDEASMRIMANMSYSNRDPRLVAARLKESMSRLKALRDSYPDRVELKTADWLIPNGYSFYRPTGPDARVYVEFFGYRLSLNERMGVNVLRAKDSDLFDFHLAGFLRQWAYAKGVPHV